MGNLPRLCRKLYLPRASLLGIAILVGTFVFVRGVANADERPVAELMPDTVQCFIEVNDSTALKQMARDGGGKLLPALARLYPSGWMKQVALAVDPSHRGMLVTLESPSESSRRVTLAMPHMVLEGWAHKLGLGSFVYQHDIGSTTIRHVGPLGWFEEGRRTLLATRNALTLDTWLTIHDPKQRSLANTEDYQSAMAELPADRAATLFVRPGEASNRARGLLDLAQATAGVALAESELPLPVRRLIVHSARQSLEEVRYMAASISPGKPKPRVTVVLPKESSRTASTLRMLAAIPQQGRTSRPLVPGNTIVSISTYLNREAIELAVETLFSPDQLAALQDTNPEVAALVEGLSFTIDASRQIEPRVQVVFARREFAEVDDDLSQPRLPAVAVIFIPKNPRELRQGLLLAYWGAMSEANKAADAENRPSYRFQSTRVGPVTVNSGILRERKEGQRPPTLLQASLEPTIAFLDERFIFATDHQLAVELVELGLAQQDETLDASLRLDLGPTDVLRSTLDNYEAAINEVEQLKQLHQLLGPMMDPMVAGMRALAEDATSPKLRIELPQLTLPFTLEVKSP